MLRYETTLVHKVCRICVVGAKLTSKGEGGKTEKTNHAWTKPKEY